MGESGAKDVLLYDGDCGVCDEGMGRMRKRINPPVEIRSYQSVDIEQLGVPLDAVVNQGPVLVRSDGENLIGPAAIAEVMRVSGSPYTSVARVMAAPGVRNVLAWIGPKLYRQRYRMPGAGESCQVPAAS